MNDRERRTVELRSLAGYGFVAAMIAAPFLALMYGWNWGLAVMTFALSATVYLAYDLLRTVNPEFAPRLKRLAIVNAALATLCLVILILRLVAR